MARFDAQFTLPAFGIFYEEKTVKGCKYGSAQVRRDFPRFVELIETGRLDTSANVSETIALEDVNDAFRAIEAREGNRCVITLREEPQSSRRCGRSSAATEPW